MASTKGRVPVTNKNNTLNRTPMRLEEQMIIIVIEKIEIFQGISL